MTTPSFAIRPGTSILIGTPDSQTQAYLRQIFESWRYGAESACTGADALKRLESPAAPAIAMLDLRLAAPAPVEILSRLRTRPEQRQTWIVLLTPDASPESLRLALDSGCDDFYSVQSGIADLRLRIRIAERVGALMGQIQRQSAEMRFQSTHDGLTGLWNREALLSLIFQETDRVQRMKTDLCLMILDLDEFSRVNHDHGYGAGDRILAGIAHRFRRHLRSYDLIGRCGEDELLLALPGCSRESALALAGRIRETILGQPFTVDGEPIALTASFGLAVSSGRAPVVVLREAERALAEAKLAGGNCARCYVPVEPLAAASFVLAPPPASALNAGQQWK